MKQDLLDIHKVMGILPHRYPFLLVDKVLSRKRPEDLERGDWTGATLVAVKNVTINEPYFVGHFPENPIMPGVIMIETMAQAAALLVERPHLKGQNFVLSAIKGAKFRKPVIPGDCLHLQVALKKVKGVVYLFDIAGFVGQVKKAEATLMAQII